MLEVNVQTSLRLNIFEEALGMSIIPFDNEYMAGGVAMCNQCERKMTFIWLENKRI